MLICIIIRWNAPIPSTCRSGKFFQIPLESPNKWEQNHCARVCVCPSGHQNMFVNVQVNGSPNRTNSCRKSQSNCMWFVTIESQSTHEQQFVPVWSDLKLGRYYFGTLRWQNEENTHTHTQHQTMEQAQKAHSKRNKVAWKGHLLLSCFPFGWSEYLKCLFGWSQACFCIPSTGLVACNCLHDKLWQTNVESYGYMAMWLCGYMPIWLVCVTQPYQDKQK